MPLAYQQQEWGFEGLDLEMKQLKEIEGAAALISPDSIANFEDDNEPGQFVVQLQPNPNLVYVDAYTCDCEYYMLISYCNHLAAIQLHFYKKFEFKPIDSLLRNMDTMPAHTTAPGY